LITSSRVGRSAIISFSRIVAAIDIQEAVPSEIGAPRRPSTEAAGRSNDLAVAKAVKAQRFQCSHDNSSGSRSPSRATSTIRLAMISRTRSGWPMS
jgi:hypothetical protein